MAELRLDLMFTLDGKQAHCPYDAWDTVCDGEIAYKDEPGIENAKRLLVCLKCRRLHAQCEIEQNRLVRWA